MDDDARNPQLNRAGAEPQDSGVRRVAIIDDDYWALEGQRARLEGNPLITVVSAVAHPLASAWVSEWDGIDVALIDAFDPDERFDRFPGVGVVESLRRRRSPQQTVAVVISGHMNNQFLKQRMFEAGADYYYHRSDVQTLDALVKAILNDGTQRTAVEAENTALREVGVEPGARPNAAIAEVTRASMQDTLDPDSGQKETNASRRAYINLRRRVADHAVLDEGPHSAADVNATKTGPPTWRITKRFLNRALGRDLGLFTQEDSR